MDTMWMYLILALILGLLCGWGLTYEYVVVPLRATMKEARHDAEQDQKRIKKLYKRLNKAESDLEVAKGNKIEVQINPDADDEKDEIAKVPVVVKAKPGATEAEIDEMLEDIEEDKKAVKEKKEEDKEDAEDKDNEDPDD